MEKMLFLILRKLPRTWVSYLGMIFPNLFFPKERIVRIIYSEQNINPRTKELKANFFTFRHNPDTNKHELSVNSFEIEQIEYLRILGNHFQEPVYKRNYYGLACTSISVLSSSPKYKILFTPKLTNKPKNYSHCDIYDLLLYIPQPGVAKPPEVNLQLDTFKKTWLPYKDEGDLFVETIIQAP